MFVQYHMHCLLGIVVVVVVVIVVVVIYRNRGRRDVGKIRSRFVRYP